MNLEYLKTLWVLRFKKMRIAEGDSAWKYQELLDECLPLLGTEHEIIHLLQQLIQEERRHEKLALELLQMARAAHPEISTEV